MKLVRMDKLLFGLVDDMGPAKVEKPRRLGKKVPLWEYDFSDLPPQEYAGCEFYEYARESATIREEVLRVRERLLRAQENGSASVSIRKVSSTIGVAYEAFIFHALAKYTDFPAVSWQQLGSEAKTFLKDLPLKAAAADWELFRSQVQALVLEPDLGKREISAMALGDWVKELNPRGFRKSPERRRRYLVSGFFHINFTYSVPELVGCFIKWVKAHHPEGLQKPKEKRGRPREGLNALGALRLRYHCRTLNEAQKVVAELKGKKGGLYYADRKSWNRACDLALDRFDQYFWVLKEDPLHFSGGWPK